MALALAKEEGVATLYSGLLTQCTKMCFYMGIAQNLYEQLKMAAQRLDPENPTVSFPTLMLLGFISGGIAQALASPFDLAKVHSAVNEDAMLCMHPIICRRRCRLAVAWRLLASSPMTMASSGFGGTLSQGVGSGDYGQVADHH